MTPSQQSRDDDFAANFATARDAAGLSREGVAETMAALGYPLHPSAIGKIERGERKVSVGEADALARIVGQKLDRLIGSQWERELDLHIDRLSERFRKLTDMAFEVRSTQWLLANTADSYSDEIDEKTASRVDDALMWDPIVALRRPDVQRLRGLRDALDNLDERRDRFAYAFYRSLERDVNRAAERMADNLRADGHAGQEQGDDEHRG